MSLSSCSRMWQWNTYFCVPVTPVGRSNGDRIVEGKSVDKRLKRLPGRVQHFLQSDEPLALGWAKARQRSGQACWNRGRTGGRDGGSDAELHDVRDVGGCWAD